MTEIFRPYDHAVAEVLFPAICYESTTQERYSAAWIYTLDLLRSDPFVLTEAFIGEYLESTAATDDYHQAVVTALADEDYARMGELVADAFGVLHDRAFTYVNLYHELLVEACDYGR